MKKLLLPIIGVFILISCEKEAAASGTVQTVGDSAIAKSDTVILREVETAEIQSASSIKSVNDRILNILQQKDYWELGSYIHPEKGVRFTMYAYVRPDKDKVFSLADYRRYINTEVKFTFGEKDGSGDLYVATLKTYLDKWVYKRDFATGTYYENTFRGSGNSLNNLKEIYPGLNFTENYIEGSEKYSGMDWNALRLVFEEFNGRYYLVAVINDEWTI